MPPHRPDQAFDFEELNVGDDQGSEAVAKVVDQELAATSAAGVATEDGAAGGGARTVGPCGRYDLASVHRRPINGPYAPSYRTRVNSVLTNITHL